MAHKKAGGSHASQKSNVPGKRLGLKVFGDQMAKPGQIIIRQRGTKYFPGENTGMGRDFTIFSKVNGKVNFIKNAKGKSYITVTKVTA